MLDSGHSIADYQIVTPLAENTLFETYQVAGAEIESARLLLISSEHLTDKKSRQAFLVQAQRLLDQSFPGLCNLLAAAANDEGCFCLYPFPVGAPLAERLEEKIPVRQSLEIVAKIARQLASPHATDLWHGSISPATICLDGDRVSLDLFALASLLRLDFNSGVDPRYSSPELVRGEPLSAASDLYSLGIVLYQLLNGEVPFNADEPFATAMLHVQEQPVLLPEPLALLQPLIDGLLHAVPDERWSADRLVDELEQYLQLPGLDSLEPLQQQAELERLAEVTDEEGDPSKIEQLVEKSDLATRIEQRLKNRAETLQESSSLTKDAKRASTARMSAISQQSYRKRKNMNTNRYQQKGRLSRYLILVAVGVVVGVIIYLTLFGSQSSLPQKSPLLPEPLLAGLELGSQQLEQGDIATAEQTFSELVETFPLYPQPYNNLAAISARKGDLEGSRSILERAMATDESYAIIYRNLGTVYSEMARDSYGRALLLEKGQQAVSLQVFGGTQLVTVNATAVEKAVVATAETVAENTAVQEADVEEPSIATTASVAAKVKTVVGKIAAEPEPITEVVMNPEPESAEVFLERWAAAWSSQDVASYLSFYGAEFIPSAGVARDVWAKQRQGRLTRPKNIEITLEDFSLLGEDEERLQVEVTQNYKSDRYADRTRKLFDLINEAGHWQIVRERSLGRAR